MSDPMDNISVFNVGTGNNDGFDLLWKRENNTRLNGEYSVTLNLVGYKMLYVVCEDEAMVGEQFSEYYFTRETGHFLINDTLPYYIGEQCIKSLAINEDMECAYRFVNINGNTITFGEQRGGTAVNSPAPNPNANFGYFIAPLRIYGIR